MVNAKKVTTVPIIKKYAYSSDKLTLIVSGNVAELALSTLQNLTTGDNLICEIGAIPESYRPYQDVTFTTLATNGGLNRYLVQILANGSINVYNYGSYSGAENFTDVFTYIC